VDDFGHMLQGVRPDIETMNLGCVGETTDTFIHGGCLYTAQGFQLHNTYSGSQFDAAIAFLRAHRGKVSPITFNLGTNDLNALTALCGSDLLCYQVQGPMFLDRISANLDGILAALRAAAPDSEIITFTGYSVAVLIDPRFLQITEAFNALVLNTAEAHRVRVADVFGAFNGPPQPATICSLTSACASGDGHPTDAGSAVIAEQLWQVSDYGKIEERPETRAESGSISR